MKPVVIIPARYGSTRLPGKPLIDINGKPMIQRVWEQACKIQDISNVIVATDDERVAHVIDKVGGISLLTDEGHISGTDRVAQVAKGWEDDVLILNVQGDLPYVSPNVCSRLLVELKRNNKADIATPVIGRRDMDRFDELSVVKAIFDLNYKALYFSRQSLPYMVNQTVIGPSWYRHIGIYAYRNRALQQLARSAATELEKQETLEQLRALEYGYHIHVVPVAEDCGPDINCPEDLKKLGGNGNA